MADALNTDHAAVVINSLCVGCSQYAKGQGFHDKNRGTPRDNAVMVALMHSELSEMLEALRHGDPPSEAIEGFSQTEEELADLIIRAFDYAGFNEMRLGEAIIAKMEFNRTRERMHGGKEF